MTATAASVEAQAKINLFLRVLAREDSGYHQLETLFARIELADSVRVATDTTAREVVCEGMDAGPMGQNLAFRAAAAFAAETGWPQGFRIEIEKRIPIGSGLGGGSADAGAVLRALNALAAKPLPAAQLATLAFGIGADVPFLCSESALTLAWGRGERLLELRPLPRREVLLVLPPFGVVTATAFGWMAEARRDVPPRAPAPMTLDMLDRWDAVAKLADNDLELPVVLHHPEIGVCLEAVADAGAKIARMSGSGSTVYGVFDRRATETFAGLPEGTRVVQTRTSTSVPAVRLLE
jgi:4-diphosphocytidyl-2-C-methyl-D-erythritol kinase